MTIKRRMYRPSADIRAACDRLDSIALMRSIMAIRSKKRINQLLARVARRLGFTYTDPVEELL